LGFQYSTNEFVLARESSDQSISVFVYLNGSLAEVALGFKKK
jgi:hypothetical protein